ncbi:hypothetical protein IM793_06105 [Pedobacter sp. MR2016-19]|uniref:hypothetical protein n=1 Tax=Pedobacter sp. MR2016-19 TaxID=2780089 RepID=UPI0018751645|nr:hypothetical protein [Pedobacter sp. MR2016-19]MBE5318719.1 hypothetical protein [Pedobacter sp. MR2016-19]
MRNNKSMSLMLQFCYRRIALLTTLLLIGTFYSFAQKKYVSANHYSFSYPLTWKVIDPQVLNATVKSNELQNANYEVGFKLSNDTSQKIHYPYFLIQHQVANIDFEKLSFTATANLVKKKFENEVLSYRSSEVDTSKVKLVKFDSVKIDSLNKAVSQTLHIRVSGTREIIYIKHAFIGRFGITVLNYYLDNDKGRTLIPELVKINSSFVYDKGYEPITLIKPPKKHGLINLLIAVAIGTVVFFAIRYFSKGKA